MKALIMIALTVLTSSAFAGKPERDEQTKQTANVTKWMTQVNTDCGSKIEAKVKWDSFKTARDMTRVDTALAAFHAAAKSICTDEASKKAIRDNVSTIELAYKEGGDAKMTPVQNGKTLNLFANVNSSATENGIKAILEAY